MIQKRNKTRAQKQKVSALFYSRYNLFMLKQIVKEIKKANKIALFHHVHPDGDSISSSYGLLLAIKSKHPNKEVVFVADKKEIASLFPN